MKQLVATTVAGEEEIPMAAATWESYDWVVTTTTAPTFILSVAWWKKPMMRLKWLLPMVSKTVYRDSLMLIRKTFCKCSFPIIPSMSRCHHDASNVITVYGVQDLCPAIH